MTNSWAEPVQVSKRTCYSKASFSCLRNRVLHLVNSEFKVIFSSSGHDNRPHHGGDNNTHVGTDIKVLRDTLTKAVEVIGPKAQDALKHLAKLELDFKNRVSVLDVLTAQVRQILRSNKDQCS